jgi:hypothetical protein
METIQETIQSAKLSLASRCEAIAGSGAYLLNGHPEAQVTILKQTLRQAAVDGIEWRKIYEFIYKTWSPRRPHFPHPDTMALHVDIWSA